MSLGNNRFALGHTNLGIGLVEDDVYALEKYISKDVKWIAPSGLYLKSRIKGGAFLRQMICLLRRRFLHYQHHQMQNLLG
jgi:hypothetical protein